MDICRTCLSSGRKMVPLESPLSRLLGKTKTYLECLRSCTQLQVPIEGDGQYPTQICLRCSKALQVAYHFIKMTQESEVEVVRRGVRKQKAPMKNEPMELVEQYFPADDGTNDSDQQEIFVKVIATTDEKAHSLPSTHFSSQFNKFVETYNDVPKTKTKNCQDVKEFKVHTISDKFTTEPDTTAIGQEYLEQYNEIEIDIIYENSTEDQEEYFQHAKYSTNDIPNENDLPTDQDVQFDIEKEYTSSDGCKPEETDLSTAEKNYIEEIKENLTNGARVFECNKEDETKDAEVFNSELECSKCSERFTDIHTFIRHRNRHNGIIPFRCTICKFCTCYAESLFKHYKREHDIVPSNEVLRTRMAPFTSPLDKDYYEVTYKCIDCHFETHIESDIKVHVINEHLVTGDLDAHILKAFNCPDCHRTFKDQKNMYTHFTTLHGTAKIIRIRSTETYTCEHCDKKFQSQTNLSAHQRACLRHETNCCNVCNLKFTSMRKLERHLRREHAMVTVHACEVCSKTFNDPEALILHRKRHTERHFQCDHCTHNYVNKSELNIHMHRMHPAEEFSLRDVMRCHSLNADMEQELKEYDIKFEDIVKDIFTSEM